MNTIVPAIGFGIVTASILAVAGVGFTLQFGVTNILNLAYGDVMTASAFVAYVSYSANKPDRYQAITRDARSRCWLSQRRG